MKQSIAFPFTTYSENHYRSGSGWRVSAARTAKQRAQVGMMLRTTFRRRPLVRRNGADNHFRVELVRISAGTLDVDNLHGSLKAVVDEVAAWLGIDDRDDRVVFVKLQQRCPRGQQALRITVGDEEDEDVEVCKVARGVPDLLGAPSADCTGGRPRRGEVPRVREGERGGDHARGAHAAPQDRRGGGDDPTRVPRPAARGRTIEQPRLRFVRAYAALPWDDAGTVTELPEYGDDNAPARVHVRAPSGERVTLRRTDWHHPELGGRCWLYVSEQTTTRTDDGRKAG